MPTPSKPAKVPRKRKPREARPASEFKIVAIKRWITSDEEKVAGQVANPKQFFWRDTYRIHSHIEELAACVAEQITRIDRKVAAQLIRLKKKKQVFKGLSDLMGPEWELAMARAEEWESVRINILTGFTQLDQIAILMKRDLKDTKQSKLYEQLLQLSELSATYVETLSD